VVLEIVPQPRTSLFHLSLILLKDCFIDILQSQSFGGSLHYQRVRSKKKKKIYFIA